MIPKRIPLVFHNGTNYDYHFIIKELAKVFEGVIIVLKKMLENTKPLQFQKQMKLKDW